MGGGLGPQSGLVFMHLVNQGHASVFVLGGIRPRALGEAQVDSVMWYYVEVTNELGSQT